MKKLLLFIIVLGASFSIFSCEDLDDKPTEPMLIVKFKFDPTQERLNNFGVPTALAAGHGAQSPIFNTISSHYVELAPDATTQLGAGTVLYHAPETTLGGANAIDFSQSKIVAEGETFLEIPLKKIVSGNYQWLRVSLSYQNYQISVRSSGQDYQGTLASFVGFNTYIGSHSIGNTFFQVDGNRAQGYWAFALNDLPYSTSGQAHMKEMSGPVMVTKLLIDAFKMGMDQFLFILSIISLSLGLFNLLPIPGLDGGHVFLYTIEGLTKKPLSAKVYKYWQTLGMVLLLSLIG